MPTAVTHLLGEVLPAHGWATWTDAFGAMASDPYESTVVRALVSELRRDRRFEHPVIVGWDGDAGADRVWNGMHRLAAAVIVGSPVETARGYPKDINPEQVRVTFRMLLAAELDELTAMSTTVGMFRSFRLLAGPWVVAEVCSGRLPEYEFIWTCPHRLAGLLCESLERRAAHFGAQVTLIDCGPEMFDQRSGAAGSL